MEASVCVCVWEKDDLPVASVKGTLTSAEVSDVTSIRFSARKAKTAAARTRGREKGKWGQYPLYSLASMQP